MGDETYYSAPGSADNLNDPNDKYDFHQQSFSGEEREIIVMMGPGESKLPEERKIHLSPCLI